jgi:hypothetical protein
MNRLYYLIIILFFSSLSLTCRAQREAKVHGTYSYTVSENDDITLKEAKRKCIELAKAEAIKAEFGEFVASDIIESNSETDGESDSYFWENSIAMTKGEWLGHTQPPVVNIEQKDGELLFTAEVWGNAREVVRADTDIKWDILRENDGRREKTTHFNNGNLLYIDFQAPADGYLAIYLVEDDKNTLGLLPYKGDATGRFPVKAGKKYSFFDRRVDVTAKRITMKTPKKLERNKIVLIFSPNPFTKCVDNAGSRYQLNTVATHEFQKWLMGCLRQDHDMIVKRKWVEIHGADNDNQ